MKRRAFHHLTLASCGALVQRMAYGQTRDVPPATEALTPWQDIELGTGGRLGVAVFDTLTGELSGHRLDERFPMCSTFKWLAAAHVLHRVDQGLERIERVVPFDSAALLPWSPVTERHAGRGGMTLGKLCHATITVSDNAAANLILQSLGGPAGLTQFVRQLGDQVTRLDRWEPELNEATPGDPRDTSSPRAMAAVLRHCVIGHALSADSRRQLAQWLQQTRTNLKRLGTGLPARWLVGSKTGTGAHGTTNDVGVYWPDARAPIVVAVFLTESKARLEVREAAIAQVAHAVIAGVKR